MIQPRHAKITDVHIRAPIVIVIAHSHTESKPLVCDAGFFRHLLKLPIAEISIERSAGRFLFALIAAIVEPFSK